METIDLSPVLNTLIEILSAVLLACGTWVVSRIGSSMKLASDDKIRGYLNDAIVYAVDFAKEQALRRKDDVSSVTVRSKAVADAANYVLARVPDAVSHFKIDARSLEAMIESRFGGR